MTHPHLRRVFGVALGFGVLAAGGCGGGEGASTSRSELRGARLVAGSSLERWGLLVIPRRGGVAAFRPLSDPGRETWSGATQLPASSGAHALEGGVVVLHDPEGAVYTYDPAADVAERVARISPEAEWVAGGLAGVWLDREAGQVLSLSRSGAWRYAIPHPVAWAAPLEAGSTALLVRAPSGPEVWELREGEERPAATLEAAVAPPGLVTAWGRRLLFVSASDRRQLQVLTTAPLAPAGRLELPGAALALAVSPSTHEAYAALDDPPRVVAVNRFSGERRELARLPRPPAELRVSPFGDPILARDGEGGVWRLPVGGGEAERLDAVWRPDLPVAIPGGAILLVRGEEVRLAAGEPPGTVPLPGAADAWWLVVRWNPAPPPLVAGEVAGEPLAESGPVQQAGPARSEPPERDAPAASPRAGEGRRGGDVDAAAAEGEGLPEQRAETDPPPPPGFYAIVASTRSPEGVRGLARGLAAAGYPTRVQTVPDAAGEAWHRGLVGPYGTRGEAEAAARQLERERQLQAWVTELGPGSESGPLLR